MRIALCDDESAVLCTIQEYIREYFSGIGRALPELAAYTSGDELLESETSADMAFLDVEMPGQSGIHVGAELKRRNPRIKIFIVTSHPDYLDEAMRFQVFRYLSKPIDKNRLFRNLKDALYQLAIETKEVAVETKQGVTVVNAEDIVCVEAVHRKVLVHCLSGELQTTLSIDRLREQLDLPCFFSTYRSFIVNMKYVKEIRKDLVVLGYAGKTKEAYLAKRRYTDFKRAYLIYLEGMQ